FLLIKDSWIPMTPRLLSLLFLMQFWAKLEINHMCVFMKISGWTQHPYNPKNITIVEVLSSSPPNIAWCRDLVGPKLVSWDNLLPRIANITLLEDSVLLEQFGLSFSVILFSKLDNASIIIVFSPLHVIFAVACEYIIKHKNTCCFVGAHLCTIFNLFTI
ncbi:hypothetical protein ACJX0J_013563, partial [Zea mays]